MSIFNFPLAHSFGEQRCTSSFSRQQAGFVCQFVVILPKQLYPEMVVEPGTLMFVSHSGDLSLRVFSSNGYTC